MKQLKHCPQVPTRRNLLAALEYDFKRFIPSSWALLQSSNGSDLERQIKSVFRVLLHGHSTQEQLAPVDSCSDSSIVRNYEWFSRAFLDAERSTFQFLNYSIPSIDCY